MPTLAPTIRSDRPRHSERGTVLIVALLVLAMLALGVGSYLSLNLNTSRLARGSYQQNAAFHLAEAGAEEAVWSFNRAHARYPDDWSGWTVRGPAAWRRFGDFEFGGDTKGTIQVYVDNTNPATGSKPRAVALAQVSAAGLPASSRMLEITLGRRSYFAAGIVARDTVKFAGTNTTVDSWNSDPDNNPATPPVAYEPGVRNDRGSVATMAVQNNAMLVNHADIWGHVATGGAAPEVGTNGSVLGADSPPGIQIDPARVSTDFSADLPVLSAPVDGTPLVKIGSTLGVAGQATKWRCKSISLSGNETLTILGDVTLVLTASVGSALDVTGKASIIIPDGSTLTLFAEADVKVAGNGVANANHRPSAFRFNGTNAVSGAQTVHIAGNGALKVALFAPNAEVQINGNGDVMGAVVGRSVTFTGNAAFHYDESLAHGEDDTPFGVTRWRELTDASARAAWEPVFAGW